MKEEIALSGAANMNAGTVGAPNKGQPRAFILPSWGPPDTSATAAGTAVSATAAASELSRIIEKSAALVVPETISLDPSWPSLHARLHAQYLLGLGADPFTIEAFFGVSLKMGAAYWASNALWLLGLRSEKTKRLLQQNAAACSHGSRAASSQEKTHEHSNTETKDSQNGNPGEGRCSDGNSSNSSTKEGGDSSECASVPSLDYLLESREDTVCEFVLNCLCSCGGFSSDLHQEANITSTHYALLLLSGLGRLHLLPSPAKTAAWVRSLQLPSGGFMADEWGEADSRFVYCGVACLWLLGELRAAEAGAAVRFVQQLMNEDGGFGWVPGGESHAASAFCCLAALDLCGGLWVVDRQRTAQWLLNRQTRGGGFNGRPEKAPDVCYSFWIFAALQVLGYENWVDSRRLSEFILLAQDLTTGGFADRPGDIADAFHTFFALAALGMMHIAQEISLTLSILSLPSQPWE
ncbi:LOW QUALITY PROTEIN: geranylgeranyl transferase type II beta subunit, putative [Eimeria mitis]|uniref:protein geranylgeranyltransferase type II n=1 Tax=Eimeria mitis TaxID=44415 RepID=U6K901_9EIME|nr:LOW QUALITY PROTEIN: geranylgeranyl transferase type II beta subunit, putative [Eimeria mitis]CDJ34500.1 geranylgeranyl transferase type II beta subunit, putative [Eimeria mitis]